MSPPNNHLTLRDKLALVLLAELPDLEGQVYRAGRRDARKVLRDVRQCRRALERKAPEVVHTRLLRYCDDFANELQRLLDRTKGPRGAPDAD